MKKIVIWAAMISLLVVMILSGRALSLDVSTLWPKILKILEKVEALEEQNKIIIQNQQSILQGIEELKGTNQSRGNPSSNKQ